MAISGKFEADFASFYDACTQAEVSLRGFEAGSGKVETALNKMANSLSGTTVIQNATLMAEAVDRIGGVSKLTETELARVGAVAQEAATKMAALGQDVPPKLQALADATKAVLPPTEELGRSWVERIAEGLLLRDAINLVLEKVKELIIGVPEEAHALNLLSLQTRVNVEDLQVLVAATKEFGVEGEQLGRALFQLQQRIAGGDANVTTAYHLMGMSIEEVKDKDAMSLFLATEKGLGTLSGAIQDTAAKDLYGGRLGASMIAFASGADEAVAKARNLNTIASAESVKALAAYQDAIDRATRSVHAWVMELEGGAAQGVNVLTDAVDKGASKWSIFAAVVKDWVTSAATHQTTTANLATVLDDLNRKIVNSKDIVLESNKAHLAAAVALDAHGQAAKFMAALELDSAKPLLDWQIQYLGHLKDIGVLTAQNAAGIGVNADQLKNYEAGLVAVTKAEATADAIAMTHYSNTLKGLQEVAKARQSENTDFAAHLASIFQLDAAEQALAKSVFASLTNEKDRAKVVADSVTQHIALMNQETAVQLKQAGLVNAAVLAEFDAQVKLNAEWGRNASGAIALQHTALETLNIALDELHLKKVEGISQSKQEQVLIDTYTAALAKEADALTVVVGAQDDFNKVTAKVPALAAAAATAMQGLTNASLDSLNAVGKAFATSGSTTSEAAYIAAGGFINNAGVNNSRPPLKSFDVGGPVLSDGPIYAHAGEFVVPKGGSAGSTVINLVMHVNGTGADVARIAIDALTKTIKQQRQWPSN